MLRSLFLALTLALGLTFHAQADERIHNFDVKIEVQQDGDIFVTETIEVTAEGREIKRGIFRDLPRYYSLPNPAFPNDESKNIKYKYGYKLISVTRNGRKEPKSAYTEDNAWIIRIGDEDVFLPIGSRQTYEIKYRVKNQIRYFDREDEFYWNVTGNYWNFPIDRAAAEIIFPDGASIREAIGYTGQFGDADGNYNKTINGNIVRFQTTESLPRRSGLTVSISLPKGVIDPPSWADKFGLIWQRWLGLGLLALTLLGVGVYYFRSWTAVGKDAAKLPVFPIYEPPKGVSPAGAHLIYYRNYKGNEAFSASLVGLASKGYLEIEAEKKKVTLRRLTSENKPQLLTDEQRLYESLLGSRSTRTFGGKYDSTFAGAFKSFKSRLQKTYGNPYFRWNTGYVIFAGIVSVIVFFVALGTTLNWTIWHTLAVLGLILTNLIFLYLMPARTTKGAKARSEIAGLRLYMETAEKHQMNTADPVNGGPPAMSKDRYEELLPFAIALNVEKPWTKYFEKVLPDEAANYDPTWSRGHFIGHGLHSATRSLESSISSSVATASVQPSSSSGSGGGGFSGGGGGGGGGGGW